MARNNVKFFANEDVFHSLQDLDDNNVVITIGPLEFAEVSNGSNTNNVYCSFRGSQLKQIPYSELEGENVEENTFAYITESDGRTFIKIVAPKDQVVNKNSAIDFITGLLIDYQLAPIHTAGSCKDQLYEVSTYLSDGTLVSPTVACSLADVVRKIQAFEAHLDINEVGYYNHVVRIALVKR